MANNHVDGVLPGTTSKSIYIVVRKKADNTEATGIAYNTAGNIASYCRTGAARVAITLATQTVTGAFSSGGFVEIDSTNQPGLYRLDVPDAAWATGADEVTVSFVSTSNYVYHERFSLSATGMTVAGQVDVNVKSIAGTASAGVAGKVGIDFAAVNEPAAGKFPTTGIVDMGTAQAAGAASLTVRAANTNATSELVGATAFIESATTGAGQSRVITAFNGSTQVATVDPAWTTVPTGTIKYRIVATAPSPVASPPNANVTQILGTAVSTPATAGVLDVNVKNMNNVAATPITTIKAVQGLTTADTIATYTGNTPQTGDVYALLNTNTIAPPTGVPSTTTTPIIMLKWLFWVLGRLSKRTMVKGTGVETLYQSDGATQAAAATNMDDGTTTTIVPLA